MKVSRSLVVLIALCMLDLLLAGRIFGINFLMSPGDSKTGSVTDSAKPDNVECKDDVCTIKPASSLADDASILSEWERANKDEVSVDVDPPSEEEPASLPAETETEAELDPTEESSAAEEQVFEPPSDHLAELQKLGWSEIEAIKALNTTNNNLDAAAALLEFEQEQEENYIELAKELVSKDWDAGAALMAIRETNGSLPLAEELLHNEEQALIEEFNRSVVDLMQNGWEEIAARTALRLQFTISQRRSLGYNDSFSRETLDAIRPSLHPSVSQVQTPQKASSATSSSSTKSASKQGTETPPKPANKADVVFEIDSNNFQKIVLESPVPVLLDVYADWCGPCKQLTPILEDAAVRAGGMFRLCKINVDKERSMVDALDTRGFPTVYAVGKGKFTDRFIGMIPQDQMQNFLVRAITGFGDKVQPNEADDSTLAAITGRIQRLAGLASIGSKKKAMLYSKVGEVMDMDDAFVIAEGQGKKVEVHEAIRKSLAYITNAMKDIYNPKYRSISVNNKAMLEVILPNKAASMLLEVAGFKLTTVMKSKSKNDTEATQAFELVHSNTAILSLVTQKVEEMINQKKFAKIKSSSDPMTSSMTSKSYVSPSAATTTASVAASAKKAAATSTSTKKTETPPAKPVKLDTVLVTFKDDQTTAAGSKGLRQQFSRKLTVKDALQQLLLGVDSKVNVEHDTKKGLLEIKFPLPKREVEVDMLSSSLDKLLGASSSITFGRKKSGSGLKNLFGSSSGNKKKKEASKPTTTAKAKPEKMKESKIHTLHSMGVYDKKKTKNNEYFGGDSTVTLGGAEDEDDDDEEGEDDDSNNNESEEEE